MHKALLAALAAATLFSVAMPAKRTDAAVICGGNGCNPIHTKSEKRRQYKPLGYTKPIRQSVISSSAGIA